MSEWEARLYRRAKAAEARAEAAERDGEKARNLWIDASNKLAAVREWREGLGVDSVPNLTVGQAFALAEQLGRILDGEGEK